METIPVSYVEWQWCCPACEMEETREIQGERDVCVKCDNCEYEYKVSE